MPAKWTEDDIPDQSSRLVVVTGGNSGLGFVTARELARAGAEVVIGCRDLARGSTAAEEIRSAVPDARVDVVALDLAELSSVRAFATQVARDHPAIDVLVNNAGVMAPPRRVTVDGFESQIGTNHLGHFALTGLLIDALLARPDPRVVTVSSTAHRAGRINFDDLNGERRYNNWMAYGQSKLANLLFAFELDRRAREAESALKSIAVHPGYAATNLQTTGPAHFYERIGGQIGNVLVGQSADRGALPLLFAATAPDVQGGSFVGPDGFMELRGTPKLVKATSAAHDEDVARRLWELSESLTGVRLFS